MEQSKSGPDATGRRTSRMGESRAPMHLVFQASIGVILGLGLVQVIALPPAELALTGVIISIVAWAVEHGVQWSTANLRTTARIMLVLKLVSLIGFTICVSALVSLLG
ncbi:hypothetical protein [Glutamicibacter sp. V16R2B1]|uniref:hypothetical protein n=1 Tax=Glutamicibacter sp. V16R2B1 TaxID=2036207 RepID=UPI0010FE63BD|nr:hypothetical protein [Glutamicibacter sp. V16R2B1]TLK49823.1 hypothetical protein FDN03_13545 [Glutamicibacter sp. V16R2B1]